MEFEWDDAKHAINLGKHGLDFRLAVLLLEGPHLILPARSANEARWLAVGDVKGRIVTLVFTRRGEAIRVISLRRSRHDEVLRYQALFG